MWGLALLVSSCLAARYPNPLEDGCLQTQYTNLNDGSKVKIPFDVTNPAVTNGVDINNPPSYLSLARQKVGATFRTFVNKNSRCAQAPWGDGAGWAGECRADVSEIRDALSVYANIYPYAGGIYTNGDPWRMVQENITHEGYHLSGEFLDMFTVQYKNASTGQYINQAQRDETYALLKTWWNLYRNTLGDGSKLVVPGGPTWMNYSTLQNNINPDGSDINEGNLVYTPRNMTRQFWGYGAAARHNYGAYENLGFLMRTQFETAMNGVCGRDDCQYDRVINFTDICEYSPGDFQGTWVEYGVHEEFHDLRKQLRSMWRTLSEYPQILPVAWYPYTIPNTNFVLFDIPAVTYAQITVPGKSKQSLLQMLFRNDASLRADLNASGWPDGLIDLALAMSLGGYYKQESGTGDAAIGQQGQWDFIQRFGYINNIFMEWKYGTDAQIDPATLAAKRTRINTLWASLKSWLANNKLKELLHVAVDYLPWPTCDGPPGTTDAPTMTPAPTTADETLRPTAAPTARPSVPPTVAVVSAVDSNLPIVILVPSEEIGNDTSVQGSMYFYYNIDGSINSPSKDKAFDISLLVSISATDRQQRATTRKRYYDITFYDKQVQTDTKNYALFPDWGEEHDFVLEGPYNDPSLIRSVLAYNVSFNTGNWAPKARLCELYVQNSGDRFLEFEKHYVGVYMLRESVKRDGNRVNIRRQDPLKPPATGGYLMALKHYSVQDSYWKLDYGGDVDMEYPTKSIRTSDMKDFFKTFLADFETMLFGPNFISQYRAVTGVPSFLDYFILTELFASPDAYLYNTYFDYDSKSNSTGGKLHAGPVFSYEYSMGRVDPYFDISPTWDGGSNDPTGWRYEARIKHRQGSDMSQWYGRLLGDPLFKGDLQARFKLLQQGVLSQSSVMAEVDRLGMELTSGNASVRNWAKAPHPSGITTTQAISDLKQWLTARLDWMAKALDDDMFHTGVTHGAYCNVETVIPAKLQAQPPRTNRRLLGMNCPMDCWGPYPSYPDCQTKMDWMASHWKSDPKYAAGGVDGTTCSFQKFLFNENAAFCPDPCFPDPVRDANGCDTKCTGPWLYYPKCGANVDWLTANWRTNPKYAAGGVDGSRCSAQKFVHMESGLCPAVCNPGCSTGDCKPPDDGTYPGCSRDMQWVAANWEKDSKFAAGGVNGTSCSIQDFIFRENATICPKTCVTAPTAAPPTSAGSPTAPSASTPTAASTPTVPPPTPQQTPTVPPTVLPPSPTAPASPTPLVRTCRGTCYGPYPGYPGCQYNIELMQQSNGLSNMTQCDYQLQLAARNICPYLPVGLECRPDKLCKQNPTAPTHSAPTIHTSPTASKVTQPLDEGSSPVGTFFAVFTPLLVVAALIFAFIQYRKRTATNRWKHLHMQDDQEPVLLPYSQQLK